MSILNLIVHHFLEFFCTIGFPKTYLIFHIFNPFLQLWHDIVWWETLFQLIHRLSILDRGAAQVLWVKFLKFRLKRGKQHMV